MEWVRRSHEDHSLSSSSGLERLLKRSQLATNEEKTMTDMTFLCYGETVIEMCDFSMLNKPLASVLFRDELFISVVQYIRSIKLCLGFNSRYIIH